MRGGFCLQTEEGKRKNLHLGGEHIDRRDKEKKVDRLHEKGKKRGPHNFRSVERKKRAIHNEGGGGKLAHRP